MPRIVVRAGLVALAVGGGVYEAIVRPWLLRWGARSWEIDHDLPGDDLVAWPRCTSTRAVGVDAGIHDVWRILEVTVGELPPGTTVASSDPPFSLVLRTSSSSCAFVLVPLTPSTSRLLLRWRSRDHVFASALFLADRRLLVGIRERAEAIAEATWRDDSDTGAAALGGDRAAARGDLLRAGAG